MKHLRSGVPILAIGYLLSAISAAAHPGHSLFERGPAHALTSPFHLLVLALIGSGLLLVARFVRSPKIQRLADVTGSAAVLLSALVWVLNS
jgi:hypothetical protein